MAQINGPVNLNMLDAPVIDQTGSGPDQDRWLSNVVDIINSSFTTLNELFKNVITFTSIDVGGAGAGPISVSVPGLSTSGYVNVNLISSSNNVSVQTVTPGANAFDITFSADPGASAIIAYQAFISKPQG